MYVCICNGVTERRIREAVAAGDTTFEALQEDLGVATCCGCCEEEVRGVLTACLRTQRNNTQCGFIAKPGTIACPRCAS
ncbi:MAG: (2Fe-2S)-binding protein [Gammaproteobacteria bacterium]|nr:(2Fe-2S)-binding protein [Gammaproteobacteria bacterium]